MAAKGKSRIKGGQGRINSVERKRAPGGVTHLVAKATISGKRYTLEGDIPLGGGRSSFRLFHSGGRTVKRVSFTVKAGWNARGIATMALNLLGVRTGPRARGRRARRR